MRFAAIPDRFDAVISDMTMPSLSGIGVASKIFAIRPNVPIALTSGEREQYMEHFQTWRSSRRLAL